MPFDMYAAAWHFANKLDSRRSPSKTGVNALTLRE
jgi:hypothetical protein